MDPLKDPKLSVLLAEFQEALEVYDVPRVEALFRHALTLGSPMIMVEALIVPTLEHIGQAWEDGRLALSQIYLSGRLCERLVGDLSLQPEETASRLPPRQAIAVLNDYHLLGKRIVHAMLRASGIAFQDYGRVTVDELVERVMTDGVDILLISTLMLPSALQVRAVRSAFDACVPRCALPWAGLPFCSMPIFGRRWGPMPWDATRRMPFV